MDKNILIRTTKKKNNKIDVYFNDKSSHLINSITNKNNKRVALFLKIFIEKKTYLFN